MEFYEIDIIDISTGKVVDSFATESYSPDGAIAEAREYSGYDPEDYDFELV